MTDTLADAAPDVPGEQPVPASDDFVQPQEVEVQATEPVEEPVKEVEEELPQEPEPVENTNEEEPDPASEQTAAAEPEAEEQLGKRKFEEDGTEEPEPKKMNTGPMEMEVSTSVLGCIKHSRLLLHTKRTT